MPAGEWFIDEEDVGACAFAIQNRSAGWSVAARRGENYRVPGRDGTIYHGPKPYDEAILTLAMFAAGANHDGSMPTDMTRRQKVRDHLDTLTRMFGAPGLREFVHSDTPDYGRTNLIPNPSMENAGQQVVLRENIIDNPSGEYSSAVDAVIRRNFVDNPGMEDATAEQTFRTNLVRNPRMAGEGDPVVLQKNWVPNPSLEANTKFWRMQSNCVISRSRQVRVGGTWPAQGEQSLRVTARAAGNASTECTSIPVVASTVTTFSGYVWNRCEDDKTIRMFVRYFNKTGAFISATSNLDTTVAIEDTARLVQTSTPPSNAATASIRFVLVSAAEDDVMYVDAVMATRTSAVKTYFDGDTDEIDGLRHRWKDAGGRSQSEQYVVPARGWYSPVESTGKTRLSCSTEYSARGTQSAKIEVLAATSANDVVFRQTTAYGCLAIEGDWVSTSVAARLAGYMDDSFTVTTKALTSNVATLTVDRAHELAVGNTVVVASVDSTFNGTFTLTAVTDTTLSYAKVASNVTSTAATGTVTRPSRSIKLNLQCWDENGTLLGLTQQTAGGSDTADVSLELAAGNWLTVEMEGAYVRTGTSKVTLRVTCNEAWSIGDEIYLDTAIVEPSKKIDEWFDGNMPDDDLFEYDWEGDPHWSKSLQRGQNIRGWTAVDGRQYQNQGGYLREYALQLVPYRTPASTDRPRIEGHALDARPGRKHRLSAYVNTNRSFSIRVGYSVDGGVTYTYGGAASPTVNTWTRLDFGFTIASTVDPEDVYVSVATNAAPADADVVLIDSVMLEPAELLRNYFDGESGDRFAWEEDPDESESVKLAPKANGWHGYGTSYPDVQQVLATASQGSYVVRSTANEAGTLGVTFAQDGIDDDLDYSFGIDLKPSTTLNGFVGIVWMDEEGTVISTSTSSTTSLTSASFTRKTITDSPPVGASAAAPIAVVNSAAAEGYLDADGAVFGFGASTDYKDGNSGSGWTWTGVTNFSESEQIGTGVDYWNATNGTLSRNSSWSGNRTYNATYTNNNAASNSFVFAHNPAKGDERRFKLTPNSPTSELTFAVTAKAVQSGRIQVGFKLSKWTGVGWQASTAVDPFGSQEAYTAAEERRVSYTFDTATYNLGDATHFRPVIMIFDETGGVVDLGDVWRFDNAICSRDDNTTYQDGTFEYVIWTGDEDASKSKRIGPARRIYVERTQAIDMTSVGWGQAAEFVVQFNAPTVFWEDTVTKTQVLAIPRKGGTLVFDKFDGMTAPINDAVIKVNGPINDFKLTDLGTGAWVRVNIKLKDDQTIVIDNDEWSVKTAQGKGRFQNMSNSGHPFLLPISCRATETSPRMMIEADSIGATAKITVIGRRKYVIA